MTMGLLKLTNSNRVVLVDDADLDELNRHNWRLDKAGYIRRTRSGKTILLHRQIMGVVDAGREVEVDHANHDKLDNRRANLRLCTRRDNARNRKPPNGRPWKGVTRATGNRGWQAQLGLLGKTLFLGFHESPEAAAMAYDEAARRHHGEFAKLNFPQVAQAPQEVVHV